MQNKTEALEQIKSLIQSGELHKDEVVNFISSIDSSGVSSDMSSGVLTNGQSTQKIHADEARNSLVTKILYVIGGVITLAGVLVLLSNNWDAIGFVGQWSVTVGLGLALYINACMTARKNEFNSLSQVLFTVSSILLLWGSYVWYDHVFNTSAYTYYAGANLSNESMLIGAILTAVFASALYAFKKPVLHVISWIFFSLTYYAAITKLLEIYNKSHAYSSFISDLTVYSMMLIGIGYIVYGYWLKNLNRLYKIFSFFGFGTVLLAGLFLGGIWDLLYAFLAIGSVAISVRLRNSVGLMLTSVAIGAYCIKISVKHFAGSLGFPFILLLSGLLIIALGYLTYYLNKKYITRK